RYDKRFRKFYDRYTKKWGGKVEQVALGQEDPNRPFTEDDAARVRATVQNVARQAGRSAEEALGLLDQFGTDIIPLYEAALESRDEAVAVLRNQLAPHYHNARARIAPVTNQILYITDRMRESVRAGQPLAIRGNRNVDGLLTEQNLESFLDEWRKILPPDVMVRVVDHLPEGALGAYKPSEKLVLIAAYAANPNSIVRHEVIHALRDAGLFSDAEWAMLVETATRYQDQIVIETPDGKRLTVEEVYGEIYRNRFSPERAEEAILEEMVATMVQMRAEGYTFGPESDSLTDRIRRLMARLRNWVRAGLWRSSADVLADVELGRIARRARAQVERMNREHERVERFAPPPALAEAGQGRAGAPGGIAASAAPIVRAGQLPGARGFQPSRPAGSPVRRLSDTVRDLERALGMTVRQGRLDPGLKRRMRQAGAGDVFGQYNRQTGVARLQIRNDIDALSHEAGHHIEGTMGQPLANLKQTHAAELLPLASPGPDALSEGFSEWFRRYVTNPADARQVAPTFHDAFETFLDQQKPALLQSLHEVQDAYEGLITGDPQDVKIANQTVLLGRDTAFTRFLRDAEEAGVVDTMSDRLHWLYFAAIGKNHGWWLATKQMLDLIERNTGQRVDIKATDNPNKLLRRTAHTTAWAMQDLKRGIATAARPNGGGVSMHDVLKTAFGGTRGGMLDFPRRVVGAEEVTAWNEENVKKFGDYLISRRAVLLYIRYRPALRQYVESYIAQHPELNYLRTRLPQNAESTLPYPPTLEPLLHHLESLVRHESEQPQFRKAAEMYYQFNDDILAFLHEKGLLSDEDMANLQEQNDYAPFQRDMSDRELISGAQASRRGGRNEAQANKYAVYQSIHGSMRDIINPIQSTVQFVYEMRLRAALNDVLVAMDRLAKAAGPGSGAIFERLPAHEAEGYTVDMQRALKQAFKDAGVSQHDTAYALGIVEGFIGKNATTVLFTQRQAKERGERIVWFYENGKPVPARLADATLGRMLFEGFTTMGKRSADTWMKVLALPAITVRTGVTRSFEFIFRNIFVDAITAPINSPYAVPFVTQAKGLRQIMGGGRYHQLYNRYAGMLGGEATQAISDQSIDRDIRSLRTKGFRVRRPKNIFEFFKMAFQLGEFTETATRVGIFKTAMESAMADGLSEFEAASEAAHAAHDVIDFSRHGSKTEAIRRAIPFWNAGIQGMDKYVRSMTGQGDHGSAVRTWIKYRDGQRLTEGERRDLHQAGKAWIYTTIVFGGMSWFFYMLGADDEDYDEIPDRIRATHWRVNLDGVMYLIPKDARTFLPEDITLRLPKGFETAWFANAVERALDATRKDDPTAFRRYLEDFWEITHPPDGVPVLDLPYGFMAGKDFFTGRDIIPFWERDLEREEQFGPYTTESGKTIGEWLNVSPYYVDHIVRGLGASVARDVQTGIDLAAGKGPRPGIEDYPIARRFTYNTARSSRSLQRFYDMYKDREGLVAWFWDTVSKDARSFMAAKATYKSYLDDDNEAAAEELYERLNPDQKVFATLGVKFERGKSKYRNLHPMENAAEGMRVANKLMKEVVSGEILVGKQEKRVQLDRSAMRLIRNELGHIRQGMAQNGLHILDTPGWSNLPRMDIGKRMAVLKEASPAVFDELMRRLNKDGYVEMDHLAEVWPEVKQRVLDDGENALLADLLAGGPVPKTFTSELEEVY
ncbi:MAG: LPD38 domain-containing protein, partial [bacterium]